MFRLSSLIPKTEWQGITKLLITHGDPNHYWQADRVASTANAPLRSTKAMPEQATVETHILAPPRRGLQFVAYTGKVFPLDSSESINFNGIQVQEFRTIAGPIEFAIFDLK